MSNIEELIVIAKKLPEVKIDELVDIAGYFLYKTDQEFDGALLSEEALAQSWLSPEDEEAWKDL
jgi:hypothetical protein